jgi:NAD(P)H-dependent FMN reductase
MIPKLLAFAGSSRRDSLNKKLVKVAAEAARAAGAEVTLADLADYAMPLYDGDLEAAGTPEPALRWKALMKAHDGFLIACPEYNSSYSGLLKNAIDWASRPAEGEPTLVAFAGKTAALLAASPGANGGIRMLPQLRLLLMNIRTFVIPDQFGLAHANKAFDEHGALQDPKHQQSVKNVAETLVKVTRALAPPG